MRGRKPNALTPAQAEPRMNDVAFERRENAARELVRIQDEANDNARALAVQLQYEGPLTVAALEDQVRLYQRRTAEACMFLGASLLLLKEITPHGEFTQRAEALGLSARMARKYMSAAIKFSRGGNVAQLVGKVDTQTKLLELVALDDEDLDVLAEGGTVRGITLDKVETMNTSELRRALREAEKEKLATEKRLEVLSRQRDEAEARAAQIAVLPPDEALAELQREATRRLTDAQGAVRGGLRMALIALKNHDEDNTLFAAGLVGQLAADLAALRDEFGLPDATTAADAELMREVAQWAPKRQG